MYFQFVLEYIHVYLHLQEVDFLFCCFKNTKIFRVPVINIHVDSNFLLSSFNRPLENTK